VPFLDDLGALFESDQVGDANKFLPSVIRQGVSEGYSGNQILGAIRETGFGISTQRFYGLLGELQATSAMQESVLGMDLSRELGEGDFAPWATSRSSGYLYQIRAYFQSTDPATGELVRTFKPFDVRSDGIINGYQALDTALGYIPDGGGPGSDGSLVGLEIVGLFKMLPGGRS
jgi:hypothetical protein